MSLQSGILYSSLLLTYPSLDSGLTYTHPSCQGRSQEFVSEGDKRVGSVTSGVQSPGWSLGQSPQKPENYAEILIECQKFHTVQRKKFLPWQFRRGSSLYLHSLRPCKLSVHVVLARLEASESCRAALHGHAYAVGHA